MIKNCPHCGRPFEVHDLILSKSFDFDGSAKAAIDPGTFESSLSSSGKLSMSWAVWVPTAKAALVAAGFFTIIAIPAWLALSKALQWFAFDLPWWIPFWCSVAVGAWSWFRFIDQHDNKKKESAPSQTRQKKEIILDIAQVNELGVQSVKRSEIQGIGETDLIIFSKYALNGKLRETDLQPLKMGKPFSIVKARAILNATTSAGLIEYKNPEHKQQGRQVTKYGQRVFSALAERRYQIEVSQ